VPIRRSAPPRRFVRVWLTPAAVALAVAVPAGAALSAPGGVEESPPRARYQTAGYCADAEERAFLDLLNGYRAQNGLGPVQLAQGLGAAAESHSAEMASNGSFGHTMLGGVSVGENLQSHGYTDATYGENIAAGQGTADGVFSQWRNSASHNANMLGGNFEAVGVTRAYDADSGYGWYWTTIYGGSVDAPAAGCGETQPAAIAAPPAEPTAEPTVEPTTIPEPTATAFVEPTVVLDTAETDIPLPTVAPEPTALPAAEPIAGAEGPTEGGGSVATALLNLRAGPGADYPAMGTVPSGAGLTITGPAETGYLPVIAGGQFGWVAADYVTFQGYAQPAATDDAPVPDGTPVPSEDPTPTVEEAAPTAGTATTIADATLRSGPSSAETVLLPIPAGVSLVLTGEASGGFLGVIYGDQVGWVDAAYLTS